MNDDSVHLVTITHQQYQTFLFLAQNNQAQQKERLALYEKHRELQRQHRDLQEQLTRIKQEHKQRQFLLQQNKNMEGRVTFLSRSSLQLAKQLMNKDDAIAELKTALQKANQESASNLRKNAQRDQQWSQALEQESRRVIQYQKTISQFQERVAWLQKQLEKSQKVQEAQQNTISEQHKVEEDLMMIKIRLEKDNLTALEKLQQLTTQLQSERQTAEKKKVSKHIVTVQEMIWQNQVLKVINKDLEQTKDRLLEENQELRRVNAGLGAEVEQLNNNEGLIMTFEGELKKVTRRLEKMTSEVSQLREQNQALITQKRQTEYLIKIEREARSTNRAFNSIQEILNDPLLLSQLQEEQAAEFCCEWMIREHLKSKSRMIKHIFVSNEQQRVDFQSESRRFLAHLAQRLRSFTFGDIF